MEEKPKDIRDYLDFLKRRKWHLLIPLACILLFGGAIALLLPPVYQSKATILIEGQQIPTDFVRTTVTSFAEERIQISTQRIMRRSRLLEIINQLDLQSNISKGLINLITDFGINLYRRGIISSNMNYCYICEIH